MSCSKTSAGELVALDPVDPLHGGRVAGELFRVREILAAAGHREAHLLGVGIEEPDRLADHGRALERRVDPEEDDADGALRTRLGLVEPLLRRADVHGEGLRADRLGQELAVPLGVDEDEVGSAHCRLVDAVERGELRLEGRPAVDRRVLEEEVVVEHDRLRLEAPPREVDVELAHVGDEDDVGLRRLLRLAPEIAPGARDTGGDEGRAERLPGGLDPLGRVYLERHVALDELVPVLAQAFEEHLHARLLPEAVSAEGDDTHRGDSRITAWTHRLSPSTPGFATT